MLAESYVSPFAKITVTSVSAVNIWRFAWFSIDEVAWRKKRVAILLVNGVLQSVVTTNSSLVREFLDRVASGQVSLEAVRERLSEADKSCGAYGQRIALLFLVLITGFGVGLAIYFAVGR